MTNQTNQSFVEAIDLSGRAIRTTNFMLDYWWLWLGAAALLWVGWKIRVQHALLGALDERAEAAYGDVDALLIERHALVDNLAEVVRAFATKEQEVIRDVLDARVDALDALAGAGFRNDTQIATVLQNLFSVSEQYPQLASADHYTTLRNDLIQIEHKITAARRFYNLAVEELNAVRRAFPGNLLSRLADVQPREKFSLGERRIEFAQAAKIKL